MDRRNEMLTPSGGLGFRIESRNSQTINLFISQIEQSSCHTCASYLKIGNLLHLSAFCGHSCFFLSKIKKKKNTDRLEWTHWFQDSGSVSKVASVISWKTISNENTKLRQSKMRISYQGNLKWEYNSSI